MFFKARKRKHQRKSVWEDRLHSQKQIPVETNDICNAHFSVIFIVLGFRDNGACALHVNHAEIDQRNLEAVRSNAKQDPFLREIVKKYN